MQCSKFNIRQLQTHSPPIRLQMEQKSGKARDSFRSALKTCKHDNVLLPQIDNCEQLDNKKSEEIPITRSASETRVSEDEVNLDKSLSE